MPLPLWGVHNEVYKVAFMSKGLKNAGLYILIILLAISLISSFYRQNNREQNKSYTEFMQMVEDGRISSAVLKNQLIVAKQSDGATVRVYVPHNDPDMIKSLRTKNVNLYVDQPAETNWWLSFFSPILFPLIIFVGLWIFMIRQAQSGSSQALAFGKSKAKMLVENKPKVTFDDVAGADEAKQELEEIVDFLKAPEKYQALGAKIPKGVLLVGSPGTGKTLLAKAVAGEASVPFFSISGSEFVEMFVGVGASRVRDLFDQAKKHAPCLIFIDEIDAVGRQRGAGLGGGHDEREQTLNQLLIEMDGFEDNHSTIVIAATNRPDILDAALLRPGRFDRQVVVDRPDVKGREQIIKVHTKNKPLGKDVEPDVLAKRTPGFTGADLANLANEAALLAARENQKEISMKHMEGALDRVIAGPEKKSKIISEVEKKIIAYHEMGHTLVGMFLKYCDPIHKVTIISRGMALGLTMSLPDDRVLVSRAQLLDQMAMMLGGRIAEELIFDEVTTGAKNDLERATDLARKMVTEYGMSKVIGPMTVGRKHEHVFLGRDFGDERNFSEEVAGQIDAEIRRFLDESYQRAKQILIEHNETLHQISKILVEQETLDNDELEKLVTQIEGHKPPAKSRIHGSLMTDAIETTAEPLPAAKDAAELPAPATESGAVAEPAAEAEQLQENLKTEKV